MILEKKFTINQKSQALEVIFECVDLSKSKIKDAMEKGSVWLDDGSKVSRIDAQKMRYCQVRQFTYIMMNKFSRKFLQSLYS